MESTRLPLRLARLMAISVCCSPFLIARTVWSWRTSRIAWEARSISWRCARARRSWSQLLIVGLQVFLGLGKLFFEASYATGQPRTIVRPMAKRRRTRAGIRGLGLESCESDRLQGGDHGVDRRQQNAAYR